MAQETFYEFTIKNTGNTITDYEISLVDKPNSSYTGTILNEKYIKVGLLKNNSKEIIVNLKDVNRLIDKVTLDVEDTVNYKLRLWLDFGNLEDEAKEALVGQQIFLALKINGIQNVNKVPTGADTLIKLTDNKDNSGLYTITHPKDTTLQIGNDKDIIEYRYRGANPKNYVTFNNEVWRIIGVFPTDDGTGNIENRIKIIREQSIGEYEWDDTCLFNWTRPATLNTYLNVTYLNGLISEAQSMVGDSKYYLGSYGKTINSQGFTSTPVEMYSYERKITGSDYYYGTNPNSWVGKVALMYASDYGYASENCEEKWLCDNNGSNDITTCNTTNWMYFKKYSYFGEWIFSQNVEGVRISYDHCITNKYGDPVKTCVIEQASALVRPVLYLKSNIKITGGDGTSSSPYTLGL